MSDIRESEVSPRSPGGAPNVLSPEEIEALDSKPQRLNDSEAGRLIISHETLRTQVSALRQQLGDHKSGLAAANERWVAARQEAETLRGQLNAAARFQDELMRNGASPVSRSGYVTLSISEESWQGMLSRAAARVAAPREPK